MDDIERKTRTGSWEVVAVESERNRMWAFGASDFSERCGIKYEQEGPAASGIEHH